MNHPKILAVLGGSAELWGSRFRVTRRMRWPDTGQQCRGCLRSVRNKDRSETPDYWPNLGPP